MALIDSFEKGTLKDVQKLVEAGVHIHVYDLTKKEDLVTVLKRVKTITQDGELKSHHIEYHDGTSKIVGVHYELYWIRE